MVFWLDGFCLVALTIWDPCVYDFVAFYEFVYFHGTTPGLYVVSIPKWIGDCLMTFFCLCFRGLTPRLWSSWRCFMIWLKFLYDLIWDVLLCGTAVQMNLWPFIRANAQMTWRISTLWPLFLSPRFLHLAFLIFL